jgi:mannose-1-phosphate guanylyltransferase / phosphomannomutase
MQTIVLMGGLGTRLRSELPDTPKSMADIYGKPFFLYQLELMRSEGMKDFIFCTGYKGEVIEDFFGNGSRFGVNIKYSHDGDMPLGTGGALRKALPLLDQDFIVIYGDSYMDADYGELIYRYHKAGSKDGKTGLMAIFKNKDRLDTSNVVFKDGALLSYDKKAHAPDMEYIDYGISILNRSVIAGMPAHATTDLADIYHDLVEKRLMAGHEVRNRFYEIGSPGSLDEFKSFIYQRAIVKKPAIFLDRDGTINGIVPNKDTGEPDSPLRPEELKLLPKAAEALRILWSLGYVLIVITNQPSAAKGKTTLGDLYAINDKLRSLLAAEGAGIDDIIMCPHHPVGDPARTEAKSLISDCNCRKPKPGMILKGIEKYNIDPDASFVVGDSARDIIPAKTLGIRAVFIGENTLIPSQVFGSHQPDQVFKDIYEFAQFLKTHKGAGK